MGIEVKFIERRMRLLLALGLLGLTLASGLLTPRERRRYDGFQVIELIPNTIIDIDTLKEWMLERHELDFWDAPRHILKPVTILTPPEHLRWLAVEAEEMGMEMRVVNDNVQTQVDREFAEVTWRQLLKKPYDNRYFNTFEDTMAEIEKLARECPSGFECSVYSIGKSYEGRDLNVLKIARPGLMERGAYWLDSAIHAREWLAPATIMRIAEHLVRDYTTDSRVREMLDQYDWYIMPVMNPDGYVYSFSGAYRYWRKNRRPVGSGCFGADLNRNYDYLWGTEGVSTNPCSDLYCGSSPASEPETQAVQAELTKIKDNLLALVTVHAYGNMYMHPWGNTIDGWFCERAADHDDMYAVSEAAARAIMNTYNTRWTYGTSCEVIYETTGGTDDWAKARAGVKYTFCPELRGRDFVVNRSQIEPSFRELWNGIYAMVNQIARQG